MLVVWISVTAVPPAELAASPAPLALVFQRLTGLPLLFMSVIAIVATLNGIVVHIIMISRVLYGLAMQGNLPRAMTQVSRTTRTSIVATVTAVAGILAMTLAVPLEGLADLASRGTLVIFAGVNVALIRIKSRGDPSQQGVFICWPWVPYAGVITSILLLAVSWL